MGSFLTDDIFHTSVLLLHAHDDYLYLLSPLTPLNETMDRPPSLHHTFFAALALDQSLPSI
ncbi:MAG: hypothetical protein JSS26_04715 [Nitrospira sp.]|nr:hypothetical protein [Nitrospira sp.]